MCVNLAVTLFPRAPCGVLKLVEYDHDTKMMTIIYEGEHNC